MYRPHRVAIGVSLVCALVFGWGCGPSPRPSPTPTQPAVTTKDETPFAASSAWNQTSKSIRDGVARALALTKQGHDLIGGPPRSGDHEIVTEQFAPAWEKLTESQRVLDRSTLSVRIAFPEEYALLDSARATNLLALGFIKTHEGEYRSGFALYAEGAEFADRAFTYMRRRANEPEWSGAAETTAAVAYELHVRIAAFAFMARDSVTARAQEAKADELEAWMRTRKQEKAHPITR